MPQFTSVCTFPALEGDPLPEVVMTVTQEAETQERADWLAALAIMGVSLGISAVGEAAPAGLTVQMKNEREALDA